MPLHSYSNNICLNNSDIGTQTLTGRWTDNTSLGV